MTSTTLRPAKKPHRFAFAPVTRIGKWAVGLLVAHVLLMFAWRLMGPLGAFPGMLVGLVGGIVALVAIIRFRERAITAFAAVVPLATVVLFVLAELLIGHD